MAVIAGLGVYLPQGHHTAADIASASGVPEGVVRAKMGIVRKTVPGPEDHTNAMGARGAGGCRAGAGIPRRGHLHHRGIQGIPGMDLGHQDGA
jgi:3-oxoacyl-[acyl-carrier-protein] synthase III